MRRHIILVCATLHMSGCVSFGTTGIVATPWGLAGSHSFASEPISSEEMASADAAISSWLKEQSDDGGVVDENPAIAQR